MGQPSMIRIEDIQFHNNTNNNATDNQDIPNNDANTNNSKEQQIKQEYVYFRIMGQVVIDHHEMIEIHV